MASKLFSAALGKLGGDTKNLDKILSGSNYLGDGTFEVTIQAVGPATRKDGTEIENQALITYAADDGKVQNDRPFLTNKDGTDISLDIRKLLAAVIPSKDAIAKFVEIGASGGNPLEMLTGMRLQITLGKKKGFEVKSTATGMFAAFDVETKEALTEEFEELKEAQTAAEAKGYSRAFLRVLNYKATHAESNVEAFMNAAEKVKKAVKPTARLGKAV